MRIVLSIILCLCVVGCGERSSARPNNADESNIVSRIKNKKVGDVELRPVGVLPKVGLLIPKGFKLMTEKMLDKKYPAARRPSIVYTNKNGSVNIAIDHTSYNIAMNQLTELQMQLDSSTRQSQPNAKWTFSGFRHHNGRKWVQLEFISEAVDTKIHNIMIATSAANRMLVVTFNCTHELSEEWLGAGHEIIQSVVVAD